MGTNHLSAVGVLLVVTLAVLVCGEVKFIARSKGESVVFPCVLNTSDPQPVSFVLKRKWLQKSTTLFMYNGYPPKHNDRVSASRYPSIGQVNVTIAQLRGSDTDRYVCEFVVPSVGSLDRFVPGQNEFFLHVDDIDIPGSLDVVQLEACAGGSVVLPCLAPHGEVAGIVEVAGAVEGVVVKRWRGRERQAAEVLFHSNHHHHHRTLSSAPIDPERLHLASEPSGLAYNATLLHLQHDDSAFYSCELLVAGRPGHSTTMGRHMYFVSVKDDQCQCSIYAMVLYATSGAVALLLILLIATLACRCKARDHVKPQAQSPIYEEMTGVQSANRKTASSYHLEEKDTSLCSSSTPERLRHENPYDVPGGPKSH